MGERKRTNIDLHISTPHKKQQQQKQEKHPKRLSNTNTKNRRR
jgi:hypothetical protein